MDREIVTSKNYSCAVCTSIWTLISWELMDENGEIREMEVERDGNKRGVWSSERESKSGRWREGIFLDIPYISERLRAEWTIRRVQRLMMKAVIECAQPFHWVLNRMSQSWILVTCPWSNQIMDTLRHSCEFNYCI